MKRPSLALPLLLLLSLLTACGQPSSAQIAPSGEDSPALLSPSPATRPLQATVPQAYEILLSGDVSGVENTDVWGCPPLGMEQVPLEYATLDLDGDGVCELLIQAVDDPCSYNGVFHWDGSGLICWQNDFSEMSCRDYPLQDGTMVRQYDTGTGPNRYSNLYALLRYQPDGETQTVATLAIHQEIAQDGGSSVAYQIGDSTVDQARFEAEFERLITGRLLDRSAWTAIAPQGV